MPWNQPDAPLLLESFPKRPRTQSEASSFGGHKYKQNKTNKLPSFIDRSFTSNLFQVSRFLFTCGRYCSSVELVPEVHWDDPCCSNYQELQVICRWSQGRMFVASGPGLGRYPIWSVTIAGSGYSQSKLNWNWVWFLELIPELELEFV